MIDVAQDAQGLRQAAAEMMEESFEESQHEPSDATLTRPFFAPHRASTSRRTLSPGYYAFLRYIGEVVAEQLEAGIAISDLKVDEDERLAFNIFVEACAEFLRKHPPCGSCGTPLVNESDEICNMCKSAPSAPTAGVN